MDDDEAQALADTFTTICDAHGRACAMLRDTAVISRRHLATYEATGDLGAYLDSFTWAAAADALAEDVEGWAQQIEAFRNEHRGKP